MKTKETALTEFNWWINNHINDLLDGTLGYDLFQKRMKASFIEALEKEKEQIEWAYLQAYNDCSLGRFADSEKYYNQTFDQ
jgi:hypothetical protein